MNTFFQQGFIKLIKSDHKDICYKIYYKAILKKQMY